MLAVSEGVSGVTAYPHPGFAEALLNFPEGFSAIGSGGSATPSMSGAESSSAV
jgi:hypothetical protein